MFRCNEVITIASAAGINAGVFQKDLVPRANFYSGDVVEPMPVGLLELLPILLYTQKAEAEMLQIYFRSEDA
jgi:hypothetical protein